MMSLIISVQVCIAKSEPAALGHIVYSHSIVRLKNLPKINLANQSPEFVRST